MPRAPSAGSWSSRAKVPMPAAAPAWPPSRIREVSGRAGVPGGRAAQAPCTGLGPSGLGRGAKEDTPAGSGSRASGRPGSGDRAGRRRSACVGGKRGAAFQSLEPLEDGT